MELSYRNKMIVQEIMEIDSDSFEEDSFISNYLKDIGDFYGVQEGELIALCKLRKNYPYDNFELRNYSCQNGLSMQESASTIFSFVTMMKTKIY